jgi:hypothetical protein
LSALAAALRRRLRSILASIPGLVALSARLRLLSAILATIARRRTLGRRLELRPRLRALSAALALRAARSLTTLMTPLSLAGLRALLGRPGRLATLLMVLFALVLIRRVGQAYGGPRNAQHRASGKQDLAEAHGMNLPWPSFNALSSL